MQIFSKKTIILALLTLLTAATATEFLVNVHRQNPYNRAKFRVKWDGRYVPGVLRISGLDRDTKIMTYKSGNDKAGNTKYLPGVTSYAPITLERGRTHDTAFEDWANQVYNLSSGTTDNDYKKDMVIELLNESGQIVMSFLVYRCWPVKYSAVTGLDAESSELAIESIVLQHAGWERDKAVVEPTEPGF